LLKRYLGYKDVAVTEDDIPPKKLVIDAATKGHRRSAIRLLKAIEWFLMQRQSLPSDLSNYLVHCLSLIDNDTDNINSAFNISKKKSEDKRENKINRDLEIARAVQLLRNQDFDRESAIDKICAEYDREFSTIRKIYDDCKQEAKDILKEEEIFKIFED